MSSRFRRASATAVGQIRRPPVPETGPIEVAQTSRAFNQMQQRLARFIEDRGRILAAVSHDLKTPLTRIRLRADLLDDEELAQKIRTDLDVFSEIESAALMASGYLAMDRELKRLIVAELEALAK